MSAAAACNLLNLLNKKISQAGDLHILAPRVAVYGSCMCLADACKRGRQVNPAACSMLLVCSMCGPYSGIGCIRKTEEQDKFSSGAYCQ